MTKTLIIILIVGLLPSLLISQKHLDIRLTRSIKLDSVLYEQHYLKYDITKDGVFYIQDEGENFKIFKTNFIDKKVS